MVKDMKKGFTLIELMGAVIILSLIALLAFPSVVNMIKGANDEKDAAIIKKLLVAAEKYVNDNSDDFSMSMDADHKYSKCKDLPKESYKNYVTISTLKNKNYIDEDIITDYNKNKEDKEQIIDDNNNKLNRIYVSNIYYSKEYTKEYNIGDETAEGNTKSVKKVKEIQKYCFKYGGDMQDE